MENKIKEKKKQDRICGICAKPIIGIEPVYIKTRRRTEMWIHLECIRRGKQS